MTVGSERANVYLSFIFVESNSHSFVPGDQLPDVSDDIAASAAVFIFYSIVGSLDIEVDSLIFVDVQKQIEIPQISSHYHCAILKISGPLHGKLMDGYLLVSPRGLEGQEKVVFECADGTIDDGVDEGIA